jgi:hypothetical protein
LQLYVRSDLVAEYANRGGPPTRILALCATLATRGRSLLVWLALRRDRCRHPPGRGVASARMRP